MEQYDELIKALRCDKRDCDGNCEIEFEGNREDDCRTHLCSYAVDDWDTYCGLDNEDAASAIESLTAQLTEKEKIVQAYATSARAIALWLKEFCNESLPYSDMIAEASRRAYTQLTESKQMLARAVEDIHESSVESCGFCKHTGGNPHIGYLACTCKSDGWKSDVNGECDRWQWRGTVKKEG